MPSQTLVVTLECAGNGRSGLAPRVDGEQWELGAVITAEWTVVPLVEVLDRAGVKAGVSGVLLRGADRVSLPGQPGSSCSGRSLRVADARRRGRLLAF